jgi:AraC-like DNA-binding protein
MAYSLLPKKIILLLLPFTLLGQVNENDLKKLSYDKLWNLYFDNQNNLTEQIKYANIYLVKAKKNKDNRKTAGAYYLFSLMNEGNKAITYLDSVIKYSTDTDDLNFPIAAYCEKATILEKQSKYNLALDNYLFAEKYATRKNRLDDYYSIQYYIAKTKSENLGEVKEALDIYRKVNSFLSKKDLNESKYSGFYKKVLFGLADTHKALQQTDSATYYNRLGYKVCKKNNDLYFLNMFILNEGANQVITKNYKTALDSIKKALPEIKNFHDQVNTMASYYYLGKAYNGLGKNDIAAQNFIKVDSMHKISKTMYPELISGYPFLINYYKKKGDKEKQLEYLTTYITIDSTLQKTHNKMYKLLVKEYDIPHLVKDKEDLIKSLKKDVPVYYWALGIMLILLMGMGIYSFYQSNLKKIYKTRFEKIIAETVITDDNKNKIQDFKLENQVNKVKNINISTEVIKKTLPKIENFELNKDYLKPNITLISLSDEFGINNRYLALIIKEYRDKSFIPYINDLRINEAITRLQHKNDLRKYTIEALAKEFGFNNAESFSLAFQKKTGIKPSYFIKELENK